jgi:hypothetical protein
MLFNRTALEFLQALRSHASDPHFGTYMHWAEALLSTDSNPLIYDMVVANVPREKLEALQRRDERVLLDHKFETALGNKVQDTYRKLAAADRDVMWKYITVLCKLVAA